ncbi:hypothetical protein [Streptomyces sp. NBC_01294]|uniref:hypothetical protein n=1 Tax=Streptomyces sp. NBC_01294 TaxID=2903815 RepID=UPI002DDACDB7|nr:hypothetical protein [Streptomyces sp. NBC_01294]WRZ57121.1 hypothetical protein OG534_11880 [Streptomyces sp. NBC_01294]
MTIRVYDINTRTGRIVRERADVVAARCPASPWPSQRPELSQELLDRARVGWERFVSSIQEPSDD